MTVRDDKKGYRFDYSGGPDRKDSGKKKQRRSSTQTGQNKTRRKRKTGVSGRGNPAEILMRIGLAAAVILLIACILYGVGRIRRNLKQDTQNAETETAAEETRIDDEQIRRVVDDRPDLDVQLLDVNPYSRPGIALKQVNGVVIHYTANPGSTAQQNRDYFQNLAKEHTTKVSSHFIIGLEGEIVQCIPCSEIAYASNDRNTDTISIECCISDDTGAFNDATYRSAVELTAWLICRYGLTTDDVIRHYDITGKDCPKYFVEHPEAWESFKSDVNAYIAEY